MRQKLVRIQISHQELLRKMLYFHKYSTSSFNNSIYQSEFQSIFKLANITSVFKKGDTNSNQNYRSVSILSKIFERWM